MLETKLESALSESAKLKEELSGCKAAHKSTSEEFERKKAENVRLMASLNEARAQLHFESGKVASITQQMQEQIA